jgi:hypothetical protein
VAKAVSAPPPEAVSLEMRLKGKAVEESAKLQRQAKDCAVILRGHYKDGRLVVHSIAWASRKSRSTAKPRTKAPPQKKKIARTGKRKQSSSTAK